ncbi:MAG: ribonuclease D [Salinisphaera sp.]|nr:ribonuclease D [Salinisphaera sp.]
MTNDEQANPGMIPEPAALVVDQHALSALVTRLRGRPWVAIDTEFLRERSYYPRLCLVQVADIREIACIDVLALEDLSPLATLLDDRSVTKVFHAAGQDLEALHLTTGVAPHPIFDTQVAAALLGHPDQIGYAPLVQAMLGVALAKSHTRSDWSRRPLGSEALAYAADDVRYLAQIYPQLITQLEQRGRLPWLDGEFTHLVDNATTTPDPDQAWRRIKAAARLPAGAQQALSRLAAWREHTAMHADRPRGWILKDDVLVDLARRRPTDKAALAGIRGLPDAVQRKHGAAILGCIRNAADADKAPLATPRPALDAGQAAVVDLLMSGLRARAAEMDIAPATLASRRDLEALVAGDEQIALLQGWRRAAAGEAVLALLAGKRALRAGRAGVVLD